MNAILFVALSLIFSASFLQDKTPADRTVPLNGEQLFHQWLNRFNGLDDWSISVNGEEQPEQVVNAFVNLYAPDAIQFVGPNENQIGLVTLSGQDAIRIWTDRTARSARDIALRVASRTLDEHTASLFVMPAPWGGVSVSTEITYAYTDRFSRRRFQIPGAVVIDFGKDGKIRRLRLYLVGQEKEEIYSYDILGAFKTLQLPLRDEFKDA